MAKRKNKKQNATLSSIVIVLLVVVISLIFKDGYEITQEGDAADDLSSNAVSVHVIDVGQGSSALIKCNSSAILIDAGESDSGETVCKYLKNNGIKKLDYIIASHPHSDHIGGMRKVINTFKVSHVIMPQIDDKNVPTTKTYEKLLLAIYEKNIDCTFWQYGDKSKINLENIVLEILAPLSQDDNLNNMSLVCKVKAFKTTFIFPGDAELSELKQIAKAKINFNCDVMIMSHHGSVTGLYEPLLNKSGFSTAVISCGKGNSYGHPHKETLQFLSSNNIKTYRTDKNGSVMFVCNESGYTASTEK